MTTTTARPAPARDGRARGVLAGLALVLACLSLLAFSVTAWVHQVALNTDRFTGVVVEVSTDPAVTDAVAHRISVQVVDALGVQERLEARLPDQLDPLAGAFALAIQDAIDQRLQTALRNPDLQAAWTTAISTTHRALVALLRDEGDAAVIIDGYVYFDAFVLIGPALQQLQEIGLIPADVQLPDLTAGETADALRTRLESALGVTLPADFGMVRLMPADRLLAARGAVQAFDLLVVLLAVVTVALALLAIWLARRRRRMIVFLGIGAVVVLVLARLAIRGFESAIVSGISDADASTTIRGALDATVSNLVGFTNIVIIAGALLAIAAYLSGRPRWAVAAVDAARGAAGQVGAGAASMASGAAAGAATAPSAEDLRAAARQQRARLERLGLAVIAFILAWIALGIEIAVIGAALVIVFELAIALLGDDEAASSDDGGTPSDAPTPAPPAPTPPPPAPPPPAPPADVDATSGAGSPPAS